MNPSPDPLFDFWATPTNRSSNVAHAYKNGAAICGSPLSPTKQRWDTPGFIGCKKCVRIWRKHKEEMESRKQTPVCPDCERPMKPKKSWGGELACYCLWDGRKPSNKQLMDMADDPGIYERRRAAARERMGLPINPAPDSGRRPTRQAT